MPKKTKKRKKDRLDDFIERMGDHGQPLMEALRATADWRHYDLPNRWTRVK